MFEGSKRSRLKKMLCKAPPRPDSGGVLLLKCGSAECEGGGFLRGFVAALGATTR
jgi:hypothetical protein